MSDHAQGYTGWIRVKGRQWAAAVTAETIGSCWDALLVVRVVGKDVERVVLPDDIPPTLPRRRGPR